MNGAKGITTINSACVFFSKQFKKDVKCTLLRI